MILLRLLFLAFLSILTTNPVFAIHDSTHPLAEKDWMALEKNLSLMDSMNFMPTLLPVIMKNQDTLHLTKDQLEHFRVWRKENYVPMINTMQSIVAARIAFKKASLNANIGSKQLEEMQDKVLALQKKLLSIKLSCREVVMKSFTEEQWENFAFVVSDNPKLSAFLQ